MISFFFGVLSVLCFITKMWLYGIICAVLSGTYVYLSIKAEKKENTYQKEISEVDRLINETAEEEITSADKKQMDKILSVFDNSKKKKKKKNPFFVSDKDAESEEMKELNEYISKLEKDIADMEGISDDEE